MQKSWVQISNNQNVPLSTISQTEMFSLTTNKCSAVNMPMLAERRAKNCTLSIHHIGATILNKEKRFSLKCSQNS